MYNWFEVVSRGQTLDGLFRRESGHARLGLRCLKGKEVGAVFFDFRKALAFDSVPHHALLDLEPGNLLVNSLLSGRK